LAQKAWHGAGHAVWTLEQNLSLFGKNVHHRY